MDLDKIIEEAIASTIKWPWKITIKIWGIKWTITITQADFMAQFPWIVDVIKQVVAQTQNSKPGKTK